jgi:protein O-GlcNAc transferase
MRGNSNTDWMLRGAELAAAGCDEEALEAFGEAASRDPGNAMAHHNRAVMLTRLGRPEEALDAYDQAITRAPGRASFRIRKGVALAAAGDLDGALAEFDAPAVLQSEAAGEAEAWAGAILWHRGDTRGARERFGRVTGRLTGAHRAVALEAIARCALGDPGGAESALRDDEPVPRPAPDDSLAALYHLLTDPPLPGIDRLRAITGS